MDPNNLIKAFGGVTAIPPEQIQEAMEAVFPKKY